MVRKLSLFVIALALLVAVPAVANTRKASKAEAYNPDGNRASITVTAGMGALDGLQAGGEADLTAVGVGLCYPTTESLSLLARWDHTEAEWDSFTPSAWPSLADWDADLFTVGVRFYLGH